MTIGITDYQAMCRDALRFLALYEHILNSFGREAADEFAAACDARIEAMKQQAEGPSTQGGEPCVLI